MTTQQKTDVLVCIPCFNSENTIAEVVKPLLEYSDADILLIDDVSAKPLRNTIQRCFPDAADRVTVVRVAEKVYTGGAKNIGIQKALREGYRVAILMDSDIVSPPTFVQHLRMFFRRNPREVVVAPAILPFGAPWQYTDTLINFSNYLPSPKQRVSWKTCLAGYAIALNMEVFRENPCSFVNRIGGDDVLFVRQLGINFGKNVYPLLNQLSVVHKPPRSELNRVVSAQRRYARSFFSHNDARRELVFNRLPWLHLLTPRFILMLLRLIRCRRYRDLAYSARCWFLDAIRAREIVRLSYAGYRDPDKTSWTSSRLVSSQNCRPA